MKEFVNNKFVIPAEAGIHSFVTTSLDSLCSLPLRSLSLRSLSLRKHGVGAGMTNVKHFNFNEYKDIENTYKDMLFFVYFSGVSYIFIIQTYIIFVSFKN